jgi:hypothetical protein
MIIYYNVPRFDVFPCLMFSFSDSKLIISLLKFLHFKIFFSLLFKSTTSERNLKCGFHCILNENITSFTWITYVLFNKLNLCYHVYSLSLFMDEMERGRASFPLFEVALQLQEPNIVFVPSLNADDINGFYHLIESLLSDIIRMSVLVKRVAKCLSQANYEVSMLVLSSVSESFQVGISLGLRMRLHVQLFSDSSICISNYLLSCIINTTRQLKRFCSYPTNFIYSMHRKFV